MKKMIEDSYNAMTNRNVITESTTPRDFIMKLEEEVQEFIDAELNNLPNRNEEIADIILVCFNFSYNYGIDIESELLKKIEINKNRKTHNND